MYEVFISYSKKNTDVADATYHALEAKGISCWIDSRSITPGLDWFAEILDAIAACRVFVLIFSSHSNESVQVKREVERAGSRGIPIIPLRIEHVNPAKQLEFFLSTPHWLNAYSGELDQHLAQLTTVVSRLLGIDAGKPKNHAIFQSQGADRPTASAKLSTGGQAVHPIKNGIAPPGEMDTQLRLQLLFGILAVQVDLIDARKFADACAGWSMNRGVTIPNLLIERGWITSEDREEVDRLMRRKLKKEQDDVIATLSRTADATMREVLRRSMVPEIQNSLAALSPLMNDPDAVGLNTTESRYKRTQKHREGALGEVWLAHDQTIEREVAVKVIRSDRSEDPNAVERFLKEARITGQLEHPNIVPVYELGQEGDGQQPFYAMRFLRGQTLTAAIEEFHANFIQDRADPVRRRRLLEIFIQVCEAVGYAHSRGILHRDLKPDNIVLGMFGEVNLLDWGLAERLPGLQPDSDELTTSLASGPALEQEFQPVGTPAYMPPEAAGPTTEPLSIRSDIYGLGAILFEILSGRPPHLGEEMKTLLEQIQNGPTPSARTFVSSLPQELDAICLKAMALLPVERHISAFELAKAVQQWLDDEPTAVYRSIVAQFEALVEKNPKYWGYRDGLARNLVNVALVLGGMDRNAAAEEVLHQAITHYLQLVKDRPRVSRYRADLAATRIHLRSLLTKVGRESEAEQAHRKALDDYSELRRTTKANTTNESAFLDMLSMIGVPPEEREHLILFKLESDVHDSYCEEGEPHKHTNLGMGAQLDSSSVLNSESQSEPEFATMIGHFKGDSRDVGAPAFESRYRLLRLVAQGGLGMVSLAFDESLKREVALKEVRLQYANDQRHQGLLLREAEIMASLDHPGIIPVYSIGTFPDGRVFYAMRFVQGEALTHEIKLLHNVDSQRKRIDIQRLRVVLRYVRDVCHTLEYAHRRGVIHCDAKPANILLDNQGHTYLVDWGLAVVLESNSMSGNSVRPTEQTLGSQIPDLTGHPFGTPVFMSPEQCRGEPGILSDVYSLGATLYFVLTGEPPFNSDNTIEKVCKGSFRPPRDVKRGVPPELNAICLKAMALNPNDRYVSAGELGADLERYLESRPVSAYPEGRLRRSWRILFQR